MAEYIEREALYRKVAELEMLARDRYLDTPTNSPCYSRYMAQLGERTHLKFLIADFPAADVVPVVHGEWIGVRNGKGICSNCNRLDGIDPLATHCRYCGADMRERKGDDAD